MKIKSRIQKIMWGNKYALLPYEPSKKTEPKNMMEIRSAWKGLELIIEDIIERFNIGRESCIEFGVEYGYSSVVFSNYFKEVTGVDTFEGDIHAKQKGNHYERTKKSLEQFDNITLYKSDYRDWIKKDTKHYNFAHVDIIHNYKETYECGLWAAQHSTCCIFHDTESFPEVKKAVHDIAKATGKKAYNYPHHHGLGIIV